MPPSIQVGRVLAADSRTIHRNGTRGDRVLRLPLPLGECRGRGPSDETKNTSFSFLSERTKRMEESFLFLLLSYSLTPALYQRQKALTYKIFAHYERFA